MPSNAEEIWNVWRSDSELRELAEQWLTTPAASWEVGNDPFYRILHSDPERSLSAIFAMMQLTDDRKLHSLIAAGPMEDFLGIHGERYLETIKVLALRHRLLREMLDGVWQGSMSKRVWHQIEILRQRAFS